MYNEASAIQENLIRMTQSLKEWGRSWELIAIDDGSTDRTAALVSAFSKGRPEIRLLSYRPNRGRGYALRQGFAAARGKVVVSTEADLTWGTDILKSLFQAVQADGVDMAIASVHMPAGRMEEVPLARYWFSRWGNRFLSLALGSKTTAVSGMTRAYRREVLGALDLKSNDKEVHLEILVKAYAQGFRSQDIPATLRWTPERSARKTSWPKMLGFIGPHLYILLEAHLAKWRDRS